jgi:hypothetical protein
MTCHACQYSDAILRGEFDSTPWNELPCATCKLNEIAAYAVSLDADHPPEDAIDITDDAPAEPVMLPSDVLSQFVTGLMSLPPEQRDVISWRYQGLQYKEIAERQGVTVSCVEKRHRLAIRDWPVLASLFPFKVACRRYRRSRRQEQKSRQ